MIPRRSGTNRRRKIYQLVWHDHIILCARCRRKLLRLSELTRRGFCVVHGVRSGCVMGDREVGRLSDSTLSNQTIWRWKKGFLDCSGGFHWKCWQQKPHFHAQTHDIVWTFSLVELCFVRPPPVRSYYKLQKILPWFREFSLYWTKNCNSNPGFLTSCWYSLKMMPFHNLLLLAWCQSCRLRTVWVICITAAAVF